MSDILLVSGLSISEKGMRFVEMRQGASATEIISTAAYSYPESTTLIREYSEEQLYSLIEEGVQFLNLQAPLTYHQTSVSISPAFFLHAMMQEPRGFSAGDLIEEIRWNYSFLAPYAQEDDLAISLFRNSITPNDISTAAINKRILNMIKRVCEELGIKLKAVEHSTLASIRAIKNFENSTLAKFLVIHPTEEGMLVYLVVGGQILFMRTINAKLTPDVHSALTGLLAQEPLNYLITPDEEITTYCVGDFSHKCSNSEFPHYIKITEISLSELTHGGVEIPSELISESACYIPALGTATRLIEGVSL